MSFEFTYYRLFMLVLMYVWAVFHVKHLKNRKGFFYNQIMNVLKHKYGNDNIKIDKIINSQIKFIPLICLTWLFIIFLDFR